MRSPSSEMKTDLKKGSWSAEEDEMLRAYITRYGIWNWSHMPKFAGLNRSGKSCRLRWMNYLKPNVKRGNFSYEEEEIILHFHSILGNRWSAIASQLPGRSDNEVKNYWHTHLKKRATQKLVIKTTENEVEKSQDNHGFESLFLHTSEDDSSSSSSSSTSKDHEFGFNDEYYDLCSPGTVKDLQCFWKQICPLENMELGTSHQDMYFSTVFSDSYDDATSLYSFYENDYGRINQ